MDTNTCPYLWYGRDVCHANALQDQGGFSAVESDFLDDTLTADEKAYAYVVWDIKLKNISASPIPSFIEFKINPGFVQLLDATTGGLSTNSNTFQQDLEAAADFRIDTYNYDISGTQTNFGTAWEWYAKLDGGRRGLIVNGQRDLVLRLDDFDERHIGFPTVQTNWSMNGTVFTESWDTYTNRLDSYSLCPGCSGRVVYTIQTLAIGPGTDDTGGGSGASAVAGDPFTVGTGDPDGVGKSLRITAGDFVMDIPGPSKVSLLPQSPTSRQLQLKGVSGRTYAIQGSTNLVNWTTVLTNNPPAMPFLWTDPDQGNSDRRFYRAQLLP